MNGTPQDGGAIRAANAVEEAILTRRSIRGFLAEPVDRATVEHLLDVAARAPSGTNMQPWRAVALAGTELARFSDAVTEAYLSGAAANGIERPYYPKPLHDPYLARRRKVGWDLYGTMGIERGDREKATAHVARGLRFFGAPVGLVFLMDRRLEIGSWLDYGMFLQNIATAARARGLDSCAMAVFAEFPLAVRGALGLDPDDVVVCGMAIGREDPAAAANALRTERVRSAGFCRFSGF